MKQIASHFGGTRQGMCVSWPARIKDVGGMRTQFHRVIDIAPTILEVTGIPLPETINGIAQRPMDGVSMAYTWDKANSDAPSERTTQCFETLGNRAIYHDGWTACTTPVTFPEDESFDVGMDTRTGVALVDFHYESPFKFTGKIDKLTFKLGLPEFTAAK